MSLDTLKSLLWWLLIGGLFFWMMRRGDCGMVARGRGLGPAPDEGDGPPPRAMSGKPIDPVCGMEVEPAHAAGTRVVSDRTFFFCSATCMETFDANQAAYVGRPRADGSHRHAGC